MSSSIEVTVKKTEPTTVAFISMRGPYTLIGDAFGKLYGWLGEKGYIPAGPPLGVYFTAPEQVPADELLWEICSPIAGDVAPSDSDEKGFGVKKIEEAEVASTMHKGPFPQVENTIHALEAWIAENGYEIVGSYEEVYLSDAGKTTPEELLTETRFPVKKR